MTLIFHQSSRSFRTGVSIILARSLNSKRNRSNDRYPIYNFGGFGDFPGSVAVDAQRLVYVGAFGVGMTVWDATTESFVATVEPAGVASTTGVAFDSEGRLYTLTPDCVNPAEAHRLAANFTVDLSIAVGICPFSISFTEVEGS